VAQVANAARNIEILRDRYSQEERNKRNRDGQLIKPSDAPTHGSNHRAYDLRDRDIYGNNDRHGNNDRRD
ncbi:hypothetical protein Tco_1487683, partial [Tanacetum coccineum]